MYEDKQITTTIQISSELESGHTEYYTEFLPIGRLSTAYIIIAACQHTYISTHVNAILIT